MVQGEASCSVSACTVSTWAWVGSVAALTPNAAGRHRCRRRCRRRGPGIWVGRIEGERAGLDQVTVGGLAVAPIKSAPYGGRGGVGSAVARPVPVGQDRTRHGASGAGIHGACGMPPAGRRCASADRRWRRRVVHRIHVRLDVLVVRLPFAFMAFNGGDEVEFPLRGERLTFLRQIIVVPVDAGSLGGASAQRLFSGYENAGSKSMTSRAMSSGDS